jgi:uncharacterized sulfatase
MPTTRPNRRAFLRSCGVAALGATLGVSSRSVGAQTRPNVVIIFADDLGYGDLACYGHPKFQTPHLDQMAANGVRFTNFHTTCPFCAPSRVSLLTGRYQFRSGITTNNAPDSGHDYYFGLPDRELTLGEAFQQSGYATACYGKWHLGYDPRYNPTRHGFDEYFGILYSNDMRPVELVEGETVVEYPVIQATLTQRYTARALDFIERNKERPFFLYLPHAMPHKPLAASEEFYTPETRDDLYADVIREIDWSVGQIRAKLEALGLDRNSLMVFTSDNGPWYGGSSGGLRGMKGSVYEGGYTVPMIACMPGAIPEGHVTNALSATIDLFPTALKRAGIELPDTEVIDGYELATARTIDGRDIWPLMTSDAPTPHEAIFVMRSETLAAVRTQRWKLHVAAPGPDRTVANPEEWVDKRAPDGVTIIAPYEQARPDQYPGVHTGDAAKPMMLFDLENDPSEQQDVASEHPDVMRELKAIFDKMQAQAPIIPRKKTSLWNGKDLSEWEGIVQDASYDPTQLWSVRDGVIHCNGNPKGYLRTLWHYREYKLHVEWRWPEKPGNSGVLLHAGDTPRVWPVGDNAVWPRCIESQLASGSAGDFWVIGGATFKEHTTGYAGSGRNVKKRGDSAENPPGEWNNYDIECRGDSIRVHVNGKLMNEATRATEISGRICLQSEGAPVQFRNVYIEPL